MVDTYMITCPREPYEYDASKKYRAWLTKREIERMLDENDCKKWVVAKEVGKKGYKHWQIRIQTSNPEFENYMLTALPGIHFEKAQDSWSYERKEGCFWSSEDTIEVRKQRFGTPTYAQKRIIDAVERTNDREIVVWYDPRGNNGKSWLTGHLWETGQAHVVQAMNQAKGLIQDCASEYMEHGFKRILIIDIPRTWKWTDDLYVAIERIKDGLIKDTRYGSRTINIHGVKVLVMCNTKPKVGKLSKDRWRIMEVVDGDVYYIPTDERGETAGPLFVTLIGDPFIPPLGGIGVLGRSQGTVNPSCT